MGPSIDPCEILFQFDFMSDLTPSNRTNCFRFLRYFALRLIEALHML